METVWLTATIWTGLALAASVVSLWLDLSLALTEIFAGSVGGNASGLQTTPWIDFLVSSGSVLLTFLAACIVVGHRGHAGSRHWLASSRAERLVDHAPCDVLVARPRAEPLRGGVRIP